MVADRPDISMVQVIQPDYYSTLAYMQAGIGYFAGLGPAAIQPAPPAPAPAAVAAPVAPAPQPEQEQEQARASSTRSQFAPLFYFLFSPMTKCTFLLFVMCPYRGSVVSTRRPPKSIISVREEEWLNLQQQVATLKVLLSKDSVLCVHDTYSVLLLEQDCRARRAASACPSAHPFAREPRRFIEWL